MEFHVPKSSTGGKEDTSWETVPYSNTETQKKQLRSISVVLAALSENAKKLDGDRLVSLELKKEVEKLTVDVKRALDVNEKTQSLVYYGFIALTFVVAGLAFGYVHFITSIQSEEERFEIIDRIHSQDINIVKLESEVEKLKQKSEIEVLVKSATSS